jgi:hypothetical protein
MPMNHADLSTAGVIVTSPILSGVAAFKAGAGWFTIGYALLGLAVGLAIAYVTSHVAYWILNAGASQTKPRIGWPLLVAYMIVPITLSAVGLLGIWLGVDWLSGHLQ